MINYEEINNFIIKVFNYYNGRINMINKAVLDINWANLMQTNAGGYSRLPNIVTINPMVIIRFFNNDEFSIKISIIETIIHELYHTDQLINYKLYVSDNNYNTFIENACEVQTYLYICSNIKEINNRFQINAYYADKNMYAKQMAVLDLPGIRYQRRYFYDHIFMCIDDMCCFSKDIGEKIYNFIKNNINNKNTIIININNDIINVCKDGIILDINEFNNIMIKYACTGIHNVAHSIEYHKDKTLIINLNTEVLNLMCKKI